jgi:hypothetical protein
LKTEYERIRSENDDLQIRLDKERESKSRLEIRIKNLEAEIIEIAKTESESINQSFSKENIQSEVILLKKLKDKNLLKDFIDTCTKINKGSAIYNDYAPKDYFVELGLIIFSSAYNNNAKIYKITSEGNSILKKARLE